MVVSLFGHSVIADVDSVSKRLYDCLEKLILQGANKFLVGAKGGFDNLAFEILKNLKQKYDYICICVVLTTLSLLKKDEFGYSRADKYKCAQTYMYEIEDEHFKNRITKSNRFMVNDSQVVVCYVDKTAKYSGAKLSLKFAQKNSKQIINIFNEQVDKYICKNFFYKKLL